MGLWDRVTGGKGSDDDAAVTRVLQMLLDNADNYGAAWVELVVRDRRHFRWDAPHPTLEEDDVVSAVYYCVPQESLLDALVPMIVHDSLVDFVESRGRNVEVDGGTTRGTFELPTAGGTPYTVKLMVERESSGLAKRLTLQIREPDLDDTLDSTVAVARPGGHRPSEIESRPRVKAIRPK